MTNDSSAPNHKRRSSRTKAPDGLKNWNNNIAYRRLVVVLPILLLGWSSLLLEPPFQCAFAFQHNRCTHDRARQFQFSNCNMPDLADDLLLSEAGFVMSHDAATGYLKSKSGLMTNGATNLYSKNQIGNVYHQLDDGARALDVRPKLLANGTVVLHHGPLPIAVTLERLVSDARRWAVDNPDELVLILHSNFAYSSQSTYDDDNSNSNSNNNDDGNNDDNGDDYNDDANDDDYTIEPSAETTVAALAEVYAKLGVNYVECSDLYGLTVGEAKELAQLSPVYPSQDDDDDGGMDDGYSEDGSPDSEDQTQTQPPTQAPTELQTFLPGGGYLLAMDRHDYYASSCAKENYVEDSIVTCYSNDDDVLPCTDRKSVQHRKLKEYALASANNEPTDSYSVLGPPESTYDYPFNEIQALWQVDAISAALGVSHVSSIIDDNTKSHLNARVVDWIYNEEFNAISLLAVDHVRLNGNALASVLRNRCGQSELSYGIKDGNNEHDQSHSEIPCGTAIRKPHIRQGKPLSTLSFFATALICMVLGLWIAVGMSHYRQHHDHQTEIEMLERDLQDAMYHCGCAEALAASESKDLGEIAAGVSNPHSGKQEPLIRLPAID